MKLLKIARVKSQSLEASKIYFSSLECCVCVCEWSVIGSMFRFIYTSRLSPPTPILFPPPSVSPVWWNIDHAQKASSAPFSFLLSHRRKRSHFSVTNPFPACHKRKGENVHNTRREREMGIPWLAIDRYKFIVPVAIRQFVTTRHTHT
jgi:hypothetical protein